MEGDTRPGLPVEAETGRAGEPGNWDLAAVRVADYLRALGVSDALELELLSARVRQRFQSRLAAAEVEEPLEVAIEEVNGLLDDWLDAELGMAGDRQMLLATRAAVLSGAVPGWTGRFAGVSGEGIAGAIRAAAVSAVPEPAALDMPPSPILLCCYGVRQRILARLRRLWGGGASASPQP